MSAARRPVWSSLPVKIAGSLILLAFLAFLMVPQNNAVEDPIIDPVITEPVDTQQSACTRELTRIVNGMQPGRLGVHSDLADITAELNRWFTKCGAEIEEELTQDSALQRQLLGAELQKSLQAKRFLPEDVGHVRAALLARAITTDVCEGLLSDSQRAVALFQFVVRQVVLVDPENSTVPKLPATPYETLLWGHGSAADRAWVFASLLRQLRLDALLLTPEKSPEKWLIGVNSIDEGILLFDPRIGMAIPGIDDESSAASPGSVATFKQAREHDEVFRKLDLPDTPYPLKSSDFGDLSVRLIGAPSLWADRTAKLQFMITPIIAVDVYDGLGENALRPGASQVARITELGTANQFWSEADISLWDYPIQQTSALAAAMADPNSFYNLQMQIFAGPQIPKLDPRTNIVSIRAADEPLHAVRIQQLRGDHIEALLHFGPIFTSSRTNPTALNTDASAYAAYWTGISQLRTQKFSAAGKTFERFMTTARQSQTQLLPIAEMQVAAATWQALTYLHAKKLNEAIQALEDAQANHYSAHNALLLRQWKMLREQQQPTESND